MRETIWAPISALDVMVHDEIDALDPSGLEDRHARRLLGRKALRVHPSAAMKLLRAALFPD